MDSKLSRTLVLGAFLVGCGDRDGDGFAADDCDDADPTVHPGATEPICSSKDNNCDGTIPQLYLNEEPIQDWVDLQNHPIEGELQLCPGTHTPPVDLALTVSNELTLRGGATQTTLRSAGEFIIEGGDVTIEDMTLSATPSVEGRAVAIRAPNVTLERVYVRDYVNPSSAVTIESTGTVTLADVVLQDIYPRYSALYVEGEHVAINRLDVQNVHAKFRESSGYRAVGLHVDSTTVLASNITLANTSCRGTCPGAMYLRAYDTTVTDLTASGNRRDVQLRGTGGPTRIRNWTIGPSDDAKRNEGVVITGIQNDLTIDNLHVQKDYCQRDVHIFAKDLNLTLTHSSFTTANLYLSDEGATEDDSPRGTALIEDTLFIEPTDGPCYAQLRVDRGLLSGTHPFDVTVRRTTFSGPTVPIWAKQFREGGIISTLLVEDSSFTNSGWELPHDITTDGLIGSLAPTTFRNVRFDGYDFNIAGALLNLDITNPRFVHVLDNVTFNPRDPDLIPLDLLSCPDTPRLGHVDYAEITAEHPCP